MVAYWILASDDYFSQKDVGKIIDCYIPKVDVDNE